MRLQFEEYLLALLSCSKYQSYRSKNALPPLADPENPDPLADFGPDFTLHWKLTQNHRIFEKFTDSHLFDIVEPRHPSAGGLTVEDIQRRLATQVADLHLDERFASGREALGKGFATGKTKVSAAVTGFWAEIEAMREAQRKKSEGTPASSAPATPGVASEEGTLTRRGPDFSQAQAQVQAAGAKAGAYFSSWGTWASEKRKGWNAPRDESPAR